MKKNIFVITTAIILSCILLIPSPMNFASDAKTIGPKTLTLNHYVTNFPIELGELHLFTFTAPETGYYLIQTGGTADTYGKVRVGTKYLAQDDDSGASMGCALGISLSEGDLATIEITLSSAADRGGVFGIGVTRQFAQIYTFSYKAPNELNTLSDSVIPSNLLRGLGYNVSVRENYSINKALTASQGGRVPSFSAEIVLFAGHGNKGELLFTNSNTVETLTSTQMINNPDYTMEATKLAVWAACRSAVSTTERKAIASASITRGADTAIGWTIDLDNSNAKIWSDTFFRFMSQGKTVEQAKDETRETYPYMNEAVGPFIFGNKSTVITARAPNRRAPVDPKTQRAEAEKREAQIQDIAENYHQKEDLDTLTLYFKEINGIPTEDYYSMHKDDGKIYKSPITITEEEAFELQEILNNHPEFIEREPEIPQQIEKDSTTWNLVEKTEKVLIAKYDELIPLKQVRVSYQSPEGIIDVQEFNINLLDGSAFDYQDDHMYQ